MNPTLPGFNATDLEAVREMSLAHTEAPMNNSAPEEHACPSCHSLRELKVAQASPPGYRMEYCPVCRPYMRSMGQSQVLPRRWRRTSEDDGVVDCDAIDRAEYQHGRKGEP